MMKKLLSFLMIGTCAVLTAQNANAQACTPNPIYADSSAGIYPDSATFRSWSWVGQVGEAYDRQITVKIPSDTTVNFPGVGIVTLTVNYFKVDSVVGQPSGFSYVCSGSQDSCYFMLVTAQVASKFPEILRLWVHIHCQFMLQQT
jgi:hypothetical protein